MYQQLKGMGKEISDGNFMTLILTSLPKSYQPLINMISLQNCVSTKPLKPSTIMESILEELDWLQIKEMQWKAAENVMLAKGGKGTGKKKKGSTQQSRYVVNTDIDYWNWGEKGNTHIWCPKKSKKKQTWSKGKGQEAHVTQAQEDYAFSSSIVSKALARTLDEAMLSQITIYDSGASMHMSWNREWFSEFRTIALKGVKAADKTIFMATSIGCMKIDMPNGRDSATVTLNNMLYCPD